MSTPELPEVWRLEALAAGLDELTIVRYWQRCHSWHRERGQEVTRSGWLRYQGWALQDAKHLVKLNVAQQQAIQARSEREAKEQKEREAYEREAVSFDQWVESVGREADSVAREMREWLETQNPRPIGSVAIWEFVRRPKK